MKSLVEHARELVAPYKDPNAGPPDPSYTLRLPNDVLVGSNLYAAQKTFDGPFQFDVYYDSASSNQKLDGMPCFALSPVRFMFIECCSSAATVDAGIQSLSVAYDRRFKSIFPYPPDFPLDKRQDFDAFSKAMTSSIVAGVGYFYGTSLVDRKFSFEWDEDEDEGQGREDNREPKGPRLTDPTSLLSGTPSRSFFPRGFYW